MSIWSKWITERAAFWGILTGFFANLILKMGISFWGWRLSIALDPFVIGILSSLIVICIVSSRTEKSEEGLAFRDSLFIVLKEDYSNPREMKLTINHTKAAIIICAAVILFMIFFYAIPYKNLL